MGISIIIPTLNEAQSLQRTLSQLSVLDPSPQEVLVVDGASKDNTVAIAQTAFQTFDPSVRTEIVLCQTRGRAVQMNRGAALATGAVLCFLHADTSIPNDAIAAMETTLTDPDVTGGGFISIMTGSQTTRWGISLHNYLKTYYAPLLFRPHLFVRGLRLLFGDQVLFCRHDDFINCGGFDETMPIMEDGDLCLKLVRQGKLRLVNRIVESSDRRVARWGALKATAIYLYVGLLWGFGVSTAYLKQFYEDIR